MENKRENFKRIADNRTNKILNIIKQLENLKNTSFYEYDDAQIIKIFDAIDKESKRVKKILLDLNKKGKSFEL